MKVPTMTGGPVHTKNFTTMLRDEKDCCKSADRDVIVLNN